MPKYIDDIGLYSLDYSDYAKSHMTNEIAESYDTGNPQKIPGEEAILPQKIYYGGLIITTRKIGEAHCAKFNDFQKKSSEDGSFLHRNLCQNNNEATALVFLTLKDLLADHYSRLQTMSLEDAISNFSNEELCDYIKENIVDIVEDRFDWIVKFSRKILNDYYKVSEDRLSIKLNYIFDDHTYGEKNLSRTNGGLLINGLLDILNHYDDLSDVIGDDVGMICQVLSPTGHPYKIKWLQIDVGLSFIGKRLLNKDIMECALKNATKTIYTKFDQSVANTAVENRIYYAALNSLKGYEGHEIYIFEVFYDDLMEFDSFSESNGFCMCEERTRIIESNYKKRPYDRRRKVYRQ